MKLYVGNLSWNTTEKTLTDFFSPLGRVISATIVKDRETGKSKGFGFVEMENAEKAMNDLKGKELDGRTVKINEALNKR